MHTHFCHRIRQQAGVNATFVAWFTRIDRALTMRMAQAGIPLARIALGIVFFWFGVLKFFPGLSPAQDLAARTISMLTFGLVGSALSLPILATWECTIGLGFLSG